MLEVLGINTLQYVGTLQWKLQPATAETSTAASGDHGVPSECTSTGHCADGTRCTATVAVQGGKPIGMASWGASSTLETNQVPILLQCWHSPLLSVLMLHRMFSLLGFSCQLLSVEARFWDSDTDTNFYFSMWKDSFSYPEP